MKNHRSKGLNFMGVQIGLKVRILADRYDNRFKDEVGTVERIFDYGKIGVKINGCTNTYSSYGVFWFDIDDIEILESEDGEIMSNNFKVAIIAFLSGTNTNSTYPYALYDDNINVDDTVVVQTGHHGLSIAKVVEIDPSNMTQKAVRYGREIISKVDFTAFEERKAKREKVAKIKSQMDAKVQELQKQAIYELLAEKDPALKQLLDEYKELMN